MKNTIPIRHSVRTYDPRNLPEMVKSHVQQLLDQAPRGPFGNMIRFAWIDRDEACRSHHVKLGTYGSIKGAPYFVAGAMRRAPTAELDFGFVFEHLILKFTQLGLGTCWLGAALKRTEYEKLLGLDAEEFIPCVTPLGYAADRRTLNERFTRWQSGADRRSSYEERFFDETFDRPLSRERAGTDGELLELVRLAPSAGNLQPWRVVRRAGCYRFYLKRSAIMRAMVRGVDLQRVDLGIAMSHFQMAAGERPVQWTLDTHDETLPSGIEYVATATLG